MTQRRIHVADTGIATIYQGDGILHETGNLREAQDVLFLGRGIEGHLVKQGVHRAIGEPMEAYKARRARAACATFLKGMATARYEGDMTSFVLFRTSIKRRLAMLRALP